MDYLFIKSINETDQSTAMELILFYLLPGKMGDTGETLALHGAEKGKIELAVVNLLETAVIEDTIPEHEGYYGMHGKQRHREPNTPDNIILIDGESHIVNNEKISPRADEEPRSMTEDLVCDKLPDPVSPLTDVIEDQGETGREETDVQEKTVAWESGSDKDPRSSPISVKIDKKLSTSRTYSDFALKSSSTPIKRQHMLPPGQATIQVLPTPDLGRVGMRAGRANPRLIRLTTVTISTK